jgi:hypothetical protein
MTLMTTLSLGVLVYFLVAGKGWKSLFIPALSLGLCITAQTLCGVRGSFVLALMSLVILLPLMLWNVLRSHGALPQQLSKWFLSFSVVFICALAIIYTFPGEVNARWQLYIQTLLPGSEHSAVEHRAWEFPLRQFRAGATAPLSPIGYGTGNASQALLYVPRLFGVPLPDAPLAGESGFGTITAEFGYLGLVLWLVLIGSILYTGGRVVCQLYKTHLFPIGLALFWVIILVQVASLYLSIMAYQNFVNNVYLWISVGMLFKLPVLLDTEGVSQHA